MEICKFIHKKRIFPSTSCVYPVVKIQDLDLFLFLTQTRDDNIALGYPGAFHTFPLIYPQIYSHRGIFLYKSRIYETIRAFFSINRIKVVE